MIYTSLMPIRVGRQLQPVQKSYQDHFVELFVLLERIHHRPDLYDKRFLKDSPRGTDESYEGAECRGSIWQNVCRPRYRYAAHTYYLYPCSEKAYRGAECRWYQGVNYRLAP